jgi:hypothetical protein
MTQIELQRISSYIKPDLYKKIEARARAANRFISQEVAWELEQFEKQHQGAPA